MTDPLLSLPDDRRTPDAFESGLFTARHRLAETGMFSDESLLEMLDRHPRELANVSRMGHDPTVLEWGEGDTDGLCPEDILDAVKRGRLWLNVRQVMAHQPAMRDLLDDLYDELERQCPGLRCTRRSGNVLVSSPGALVYYHIDVPQNILWHVRGTKRVWAYPERLRDTPHDELEAIIAVKRAEDFPYEPAWDDAAFVADMDPGDWITWPQHTPHRVQNLGGLNVSLSTEHYTPRAFRYVRAHRANRLLRDRLGFDSKRTATGGIGYRLKSTAYLVGRTLERYVARARTEFDYPVTFRVDPDSPTGVAGEGDPDPAADTVVYEAERELVGA